LAFSYSGPNWLLRFFIERRWFFLRGDARQCLFSIGDSIAQKFQHFEWNPPSTSRVALPSLRVRMRLNFPINDPDFCSAFRIPFSCLPLGFLERSLFKNIHSCFSFRRVFLLSRSPTFPSAIYIFRERKLFSCQSGSFFLPSPSTIREQAL